MQAKSRNFYDNLIDFVVVECLCEYVRAGENEMKKIVFIARNSRCSHSKK